MDRDPEERKRTFNLLNLHMAIEALQRCNRIVSVFDNVGEVEQKGLRQALEIELGLAETLIHLIHIKDPKVVERVGRET